MLNKEIWAVIPAAGVGKRMRADRPKQYLPLLGKTVIEHTIDCFLQHPNVTGIVLSLGADDPYWASLTIPTNKPVYTVDGGTERSDSVFNALQFLGDELKLAHDAWVMVHDAARPCLLQQDIDALLDGLLQNNNTVGGILASPVRDTMKRASGDNSSISHTEDRDGLWHALTPQMFQLGALREALQQSLDTGTAITDDASAFENIGLSPRLIEGDASNIKITKPSDLALAEFFLSTRGAS